MTATRDDTMPASSDDPPARWVAPGAAGLFGVAFVVLAAMVGNGPLAIDNSVRDAVGAGGSVGPVLQALNLIGGAVVWDVGVAILVAALWVGGRQRPAVWLAGGVLAGEVLSTAAKVIVDRPRPPGISVVDLVTQASYPSGHVTRAAITAALLVLLLAHGRWSRLGGAVAVIAVAGLMGLARIVSGEHWPTDVLGAYLIAGAVVAAVLAVSRRIRESVPARRPQAPLASPDEAPPP